MPTKYDWYQTITEKDVQQGDFIFDLEVPLVQEVGVEEPKVKMETYDVIIMTQSCDIPKKSIKQIAMCPVWDISKLEEDNAQFKDENYLEDLRRGRDYKYHLINKCDIDGFKSNYKIVQFEMPLIMKKETVIEELESRGKHLRLLPPYREEMSQRFGLYFARVAKPIDIPEFVKSK